MLEPSFYRLYRRSRYSGSEDNQVTGSSQHQKEMFAVAAVAFVLKHDEKFRAHFLHKICGFAVSVVPPRLRIEVQPNDHSDLALKDDANLSVFIVEFKVGAELKPKQNPKHEKAFFAKDGYGTLILEDCDYINCAKKSYIVLDDSEAFDDCDWPGLTCKSRRWAALVPEGETVGELWADLRNSLGELGVAAFQLEKLKNMKNAKLTKHAVEMHQTLSRVASQLKFGSSGGENINFGDGDSAWYGRHIPSGKLLDFDGLKSCVEAQKSPLGWFGYQSEKEHSERAVTFWCGSDEAAKNTQAFIDERMRNGPPGKSVIKEKEVYFQLDGEADFGDAEWFDEVFKALADKKKEGGKP
jgi:hypothetical protein